MFSTLVGILAMAPTPQDGESPGILFTLGPILLIFGMFYFLLIAPARKKQKKHTEMIEALKAGDKVITNGGICCTVVGVTDKVIQVKIADQVKIDIAKNAVAGFQQES